VSTPTFAVPTSAETAKTFVVVTAFENHAFPLTERAFPEALTPMPILEVARVATFAVPTFAEVAKTLVVRKLLEIQAFPVMVRFAPAKAPTSKDGNPRIVCTVIVPVMFAEVAKTLVVRKLLETHAFP
jgi:hypothetical protein